ncbi:MAG: phosphoenolpyruvate--protein phosphotransferase [Anaerocolumna sp.]|jgi:phosphotransferase system enzyme I (PtsI)|nr:phosphoenolpyruvate--protein phosphotransferase [Anaerocolumna sp.]
MQTFQGKSVFGGIAMGRIMVYQKHEQQVKRSRVSDTDAEVLRFREARDTSIVQLKHLYETSVNKIGESEAAIFEVHQMMLEDMDYNESVESIICSQKVNAEYAVATTADNFARMFSAMEDEYMKGRAADVRDVSERLLGSLMGKGGEGILIEEPVILVAEDLAPSETVQLDKDKVLAFVTVKGSVNSHTAILARNMNIPALVGTSLTKKVMEQINGKEGVVDGFEGSFLIEPEESVKSRMQERQKAEAEKKLLLQTLKGKANVTLDGKEIKLYANIGNSSDLATVLQNDAGGIGLFRSEFIYLEKENYPTEEEQFNIYKTVAETMAGRKVIIRTLDIGADKQAEYFKLPYEENPAMGYRAIRICLTRPEIFKTQLRALFRASAYGNIAIMYPMIISIKEVQRIRKIAEEVKTELKDKGIAFGQVEQGIMIETPAAVMISEELAKEVDFFSIGTNDLTQYTLAIDRQNSQLDEFYDAHHPAILRMIQMVIENAHKAGIWAGICGELGADMELTRIFLKMGVDELSVSPGAILPIRKIIRESNISKL